MSRKVKFKMALGRTVVQQGETLRLMQGKINDFFFAMEGYAGENPVVDIVSRCAAITWAAEVVSDTYTTVLLNLDYNNPYVGATLVYKDHSINLDIQWKGLESEWRSGESDRFNELSAYLATEIILLKNIAPLVSEGSQFYKIPDHSLLHRYMVNSRLKKGSDVWVVIETDRNGEIIRAGVSHRKPGRPLNIIKLQSYYLQIIN